MGARVHDAKPAPIETLRMNSAVRVPSMPPSNTADPKMGIYGDIVITRQVGCSTGEVRTQRRERGS